MSRRTRLAALAVVFAAALALTAVPLWWSWSELPVFLPTRWSGSTPNGSAAKSGFVRLLVWQWGLMFFVTFAVAWWSRSIPVRALPKLSVASVGFVGGFVTWMFAGVAATTVWVSKGLVDWHDAASPWWDMWVRIALGVVGGSVCARLMRGLPVAVDSSTDAATVRATRLQPGEKAVWVGRAIHASGRRAGVALMVIGAVVGALAGLSFGVVALAIGILMLALSEIRVTVDGSGLTVEYGVARWPHTHVKLADIESASVDDVRSLRWVGWGYAGSLRLIGAAAVIVRRGPAVRLQLTRGRYFLVTVDHPAGAAALLEGEIERRGAPHAS